MSTELTISIGLGSGQTGLTLTGQFIDEAGADVGSLVTTGFVEIGAGNYIWTGVPLTGAVAFKILSGVTVMAVASMDEEIDLPADPSDWEDITNIYSSVVDADAYFATRLWTEAWDEATHETKLKALTMATAKIDNLSFHGSKTDADQVLEFPRNDGEEIPTAIRRACCLIALALLDGKNPEEEYNTLRTKIAKFGPLNTEQDTTQIPAHIANGIPSVEAWHLLMPYLRDNRSITLSRIG
jgi:hypothetical protein